MVRRDRWVPTAINTATPTTITTATATIDCIRLGVRIMILRDCPVASPAPPTSRPLRTHAGERRTDNRRLAGQQSQLCAPKKCLNGP